MAPAVTLADDAIGTEVQRILACKKPQLLAEYKKIDFSGFELSSVELLRTALLKHYFYCLLDSQKLSPPYTSPPQAADSEVPGSSQRSEPVITPSPTASSSKSYRQAVTAMQSSIPSALQSNHIPKRLAKLEDMVKDHQHQIQAFHREAEEATRRARSLQLVLYNIPEVPEQEEDDDAIFAAVTETHADLADITIGIRRLGKSSLEQGRHRPALVRFSTQDEKHLFLKHAKVLKPTGVKWDDYLTQQQQKERQGLSADFQALKTKGYTPFFRGSVLKYRHAEKTRNCRLGQALKAPNVQ